jgi:hypothetical protein
MAQGKKWACLGLVALLGCLVVGGWLSGWALAEPAPRKAPVKKESKEEAEARRLAATYLRGLSAEEIQKFRKRLPYRSLSERLAYEKKAADGPAPRLSEQAERNLKEQEKQLAGWTNRAESLRALHTREVERFVNSPGFGRGRMLFLPSFLLDMPKAPPVPLITLGVPGPGKGAAWARVPDKGVADPTGASIQPARDELAGLHRRGLFDFANPSGFGHVKDRDHVAGFQPHAFRVTPALKPKGKKPAGKETWKVGQLELVSLLTHDKPAVYVSRNLPRMKDLGKAKTRPLTEFEAKALGSLRKGQDLVAEATPGHIRMLGALRAARQCLECHEGQRGKLLGAFSYQMSRVPVAPGKDK